MNTENFLFAFGLTFFAGLSTGIGSLAAFFSKTLSPKFLAASLGFSAGVMIYVSFVEILAKSKHYLQLSLGEKAGYSLAVFSFFLGIALIALIDRMVPKYENPHEFRYLHKKSFKEFKDHNRETRHTRNGCEHVCVKF